METSIYKEDRLVIVTTIKISGSKEEFKNFNDNKLYEEIKKLKIKNIIRAYISNEYDNMRYYDVLHYAF